VISRYFELDADRDDEAIVALFADDATVIDEGEARRGLEQIRAWRAGPVRKYTYTTELFSSETVASDRYLVTGRLTGNFPGGVVDLTWDITIADGLIKQLVIAP
jgi:ketosteroid isomerase-like protein